MSEKKLDLARIVFSVLAIAGLAGFSLWVMRPFLLAIIWATMIAVATWPIMLWFERKLWKKRSLAVTVMTLGLLAVVVVPAGVTVIALLENVDEIKAFAADLPNKQIPPAPAWLGKIPALGDKAVATWNQAAAQGCWEDRLIPNPIRKVLSSIQEHRVRALLMGGQACVLYGAAEFSRDIDLAILADPGNLVRLRNALSDLRAQVIAVPPLAAKHLRRGHANHLRKPTPVTEMILVLNWLGQLRQKLPTRNK